MKERGMKKWLPYKSLTSQADFLQAMRKERAYQDKPQIAQDKAEEINALLSSYQGQEVTVTFYLNGQIRKSDGIIHWIDAVFKAITINDMKIAFSNIVDIVNC